MNRRCPRCGESVFLQTFKGRRYLTPHRHKDQSGVSNPFNAPRICEGTAPRHIALAISAEWERKLSAKSRRNLYSYGPTKFCLHGIESSAMSMCEKCREDREHGLPHVVICPHFPKGRPPYQCAACNAGES